MDKNLISELSFEEFSKYSRVSTDEYEALVNVPGITDPKTHSKVRVSITFSYSESFPKPKDEITEEEIEEAKKKCYDQLKKPVLTDEQFEELKKELMRALYGRSYNAYLD